MKRLVEKMVTENSVIYHFEDMEAKEKFNRDHIEPDMKSFTNCNLGIPFGGEKMNMKQIWKQKINELQEIIDRVPMNKDVRLLQLYRKKELLEKAFNCTGNVATVINGYVPNAIDYVVDRLDGNGFPRISGNTRPDGLGV